MDHLLDEMYSRFEGFLDYLIDDLSSSDYYFRTPMPLGVGVSA